MPNKKLILNKVSKFLTYTHDSDENRSQGLVKQKMLITVEYFPEENNFVVVSIDILQDGKHKVDISKLLDEAPGKPLDAILEAVNWQEIYSETTQSA